MNNDFPRIITLLRKEKKLSQKQVAADLEISQALLSHYEKGIRECGLEFLVKIAEYYDVSCDYLLGRTPQRYSDITDAENDMTSEKKTAVSQILNKRLITNSLGVLYDYLIKAGNRKLSNEVSAYLMLSVYFMFRRLYSANQNNPQDMFAMKKNLYPGYTTAVMQILSTRIYAATEPSCTEQFVKNCGIMQLSPDIIAQEYPQIASSLFNLIQYAESYMNPKRRL